MHVRAPCLVCFVCIGCLWGWVARAGIENYCYPPAARLDSRPPRKHPARPHTAPAPSPRRSVGSRTHAVPVLDLPTERDYYVRTD